MIYGFSILNLKTSWIFI